MEFRIGWHHGCRGTFRFDHPIYIHPSVYIDNTHDILFGRGVSVSRNVEIYTHDHYHDGHTITEDVKNGRIKASPKRIGNDVYIGAGAKILESCRIIGDGAVIGANSTVTKSIPPYEIWAGNPARKIKDRPRNKPNSGESNVQ